MKENNGQLKDKILLALDSSPSYGYDLLKTLNLADLLRVRYIPVLLVRLVESTKWVKTERYD
ncbi:MAG: hypothetical protein ACXAB0_15215 [Candidatus Thorarchaeota archaeon]|jgi:hypothetical protein